MRFFSTVPRRSVLRRLLATGLAGPAASLLGATTARAQADVLKLVVAAPPGGITDQMGRLLAEPLRQALGQTVLVENRPGASGALAARAVLQAPADGRTLFLATSTSLTLPTLLKQPAPFDAQKDFAPVALLAGGDGLLVVPASLPVNTVQELVAHLKARPGQLNYGSAGIASTNHLALALLLDRIGADAVHVPYTGAGPAITALLGGQFQLYVGDIGSIGAQVRAGKLKALAQVGLKRSPAFPDVPTLAETVAPGYRATFWLGLLARADTPAPLLAKLNDAANQAVVAEAVRAQLVTMAFEGHTGPPRDLAEQIASDLATWGPLIRKHHITAQ